MAEREREREREKKREREGSIAFFGIPELRGVRRGI